MSKPSFFSRSSRRSTTPPLSEIMNCTVEDVTQSIRNVATACRTTAFLARDGFLQGRQAARLHTVSFVRRFPASKAVSDDYIHGALDIFAAGVLFAASARLLYLGTRRFATGADIPPALIRRQGVIHGSVVSINDGDNLRIRHTPFIQRALGWYMKPRSKNISHLTINVRLAAVDAPECGHFGAKGQKYGPIAREYLRKRYLGRRVAVKIHSLDQYRRVVGTVWAQSRIPILRELGIARTNVGLDLARAGYATVYRQAGAQYGGLKRQYERAEAFAKKKRKGMWRDKKNVTPAEYKRALRASKTPSDGLKKKAEPASGGEEVSLDAFWRLMVDGYNFLRRFR